MLLSSKFHLSGPTRNAAWSSLDLEGRLVELSCSALFKKKSAFLLVSSTGKNTLILADIPYSEIVWTNGYRFRDDGADSARRGKIDHHI